MNPIPEDQIPDATPVLSLRGEVDMATSHALTIDLGRFFSEGHATIVVDMSLVTFVDSTALGVLVLALRRCRELGGQLHLIIDAPRILRLFQITGLADSFQIHSSRSPTALPPKP